MTTATVQPVGRIMLRNVRLAFPKLFVPEAIDDGKPMYGALLILGPDHPQLGEIKQKMQAVAKEKWQAKAVEVYKGVEKADKLALHDGDTKAQYDGFSGNFFVSANAKETERPTIVDGNKSPLTAKDGKPYSGCYVNVSIDFWAQDNNFGKRINAQLRGVQFLRDGDAFAAGRPADSNEFEPVTEGATAEEFA
jgi:hypothetical protein